MSISETITIDAEPAIAQLNAFADAAVRADEAFAKLGKGGGFGASLDKLAASMSAAADRIEAASTRAAASMGRLSTASRSATGGVDALGASADKAGAGLDRAAAGADAAAVANDRLAKSSDAGAVAMDRQAAAGKRANEGFFSKHKEFILGTALVMGYAVDKAMKFNAQMTLLMTQAGVSSKQMPQLTKGVLELAGQVGQSPGNLAESLYHVESNMASLGIKAPRALEMVKVAAEGASVGHANLVDVTNALTAAVASNIPGVTNYSKAMGVLNSTVGAGDMSMQDLADAFSTGLLASVKGYGLNIKDVGAALAVFGDNNIRGAKAGTDLRMAVQALSVPTKNGKAQLEAWGRSMDSLSKDMQQGGLNKALKDLNSLFKEHGITAKTEGQYITDMFGKKAGVGLSVLMEQMDRLQSKYPALTEGANKFGQAWATTLQTPQQKLHNLEQGAQALAITAGNVLMPAASTMLGGLNKAMSWVQGNAFASKGLALGAGTLVAGGLAKGLFSGIESGLSGIGKVGSLLKIPGMDKLAGLGGGATALNGSAANLNGSAARLSAAAGELSGSAGKLDAGAAGGAGKGGLPGVIPGGAGAAGAAENAAARTVPFSLGMLSPVAAGVLGGVAAAMYANQFRYTEHPAPAGQLGPRSYGSPASAAGSQAWRQYDTAAAQKVTVDTSQMDVAKAKITSALNGIGGLHVKPVKVPAPDISAVDTAKAKVGQQAALIHQNMQSELSKKTKMAAPDLSAAQADVGQAKAIGANISAGLAAGITAGIPAITAAAAAAANAASAAMAHAAQTRSPSRKTHQIGTNIWQGLVLGLEGGKSAVDAAAQALGRNAAKAADITAIDQAVSKAESYVSKDSALVKWLKADQGRLHALANERAKLEQEIQDSEQIAKNVISGASIMGAATAVRYDPASQQSASGLAVGMQAQAANLKLFAQQIAKLKAMGLNATSLSQIIQAGPDQGLPIAQGLTSGGKGAIGQINALEAQIQGSAAKIGDIGGPAMYQAGVDAGKGLAAGLKSQLGTVEAAIAQLAKSMVAAIRKALKSHSPSLVFQDIGIGIPQGLALGVDAGSAVAEAAVRRMGQQAAGAWPGVAPASHVGGGGHTTIIQVQGHVMTERDLVSMVQEHVLTRATNNWQTGWRPLGRAG